MQSRSLFGQYTLKYEVLNKKTQSCGLEENHTTISFNTVYKIVFTYLI
jgi:hypothetical protein